jgi:hypothetical protein
MPYFIAIHDGEENLHAVWFIATADARPDVAGVDEFHEIQAALSVDSEDDWMIEQRAAKTLPPIVLPGGTFRQQNWLDRLAYNARGSNWLTSYTTGPYKTNLGTPGEVLAGLQDGTLTPDPRKDVVIPLGWEDGQP